MRLLELNLLSISPKTYYPEKKKKTCNNRKTLQLTNQASEHKHEM